MFHATAHHLRPHRLLAGIRPQPIFLRSATQSTQRKRRVLEQPPEEDLRPPLRWGPILFKVSNFAIIPCNYFEFSTGFHSSLLATVALCYAVFFADFGEREHVFSPVSNSVVFGNAMINATLALPGQEMASTPKGILLLIVT